MKHLQSYGPSRLLQMPRVVDFGIRVDTAPEWLWLLLLTVSLWPTWWWMARRMTDGSDDPLGLLALAALGSVVWAYRYALRPSPRLGWLATALCGAVLATAARSLLPDLAAALIALLALAAGLTAFLPTRVNVVPVIGLSVLSLPLLASLQFYAGYPLRVLTAELSRWLLMVQHEVTRSGTSLQVNGHLIIVDAPCSGVQMVWFGYFTACVVAIHAGGRHAGFTNGLFLRRLPLASAMVLAGNVVRNTILVALDASGQTVPAWAHEGVGLAMLAVVCCGIVWVMSRPSPQFSIGGVL